jgi:hypothetical protein
MSLFGALGNEAQHALGTGDCKHRQEGGGGSDAGLRQKLFTEDPSSEGSNILVWFGSLYVLPSP